MKTSTTTNPTLVGQYAVTRPTNRSGVYRTAYYKSLTDALVAKGRIGTIEKLIAK